MPVPALTVDWTERGVVVAGDGTPDPAGVAELAAAGRLAAAGGAVVRRAAGTGRADARTSTCWMAADFIAAHRPDLIVSAGRPGLSRGQLALLRAAGLPAGTSC